MSRTNNHGNYKRHNKNHPIYYKWMTKEPKQWRKMMKHKKRRSSLRLSLYNVMNGNLDTEFPQDRKPHIYYW